MYIRVKAFPGSKEEKIEQSKGKENEFSVWVRQKAERGEANKRICEIINQQFQNPAGGVRIINGHHSPIKLMRVGED